MKPPLALIDFCVGAVGGSRDNNSCFCIRRCPQRLSTVLSDAGRSGRERYLLGLLKTATTPTTHRKIFCTDPRTVAGLRVARLSARSRGNIAPLSLYVALESNQPTVTDSRVAHHHGAPALAGEGSNLRPHPSTYLIRRVALRTYARQCAALDRIERTRLTPRRSNVR